MRVVNRDLTSADDGALAIARAAGPHGTYVHNALTAGEGEGFVLTVDGHDAALVWIGPRGNLVVVSVGETSPELAARCAQGIRDRKRAWRIAMGPTSVVECLRERLPVKPLMCRDQVYYTGAAATVAREHIRAEMRPAERSDRDRLVQATLLLNASDLNVDPARVDRRWLRDTIDERIENHTTRVLGPIGAPVCKLDFGSQGPGGCVLEGVFTFPEQRGQGLATALVASCLAELALPVCLHVGKHNRPARAAYERAGMTAAAECRLLLLP